jgi:peroxiredoxin
MLARRSILEPGGATMTTKHAVLVLCMLLAAGAVRADTTPKAAGQALPPNTEKTPISPVTVPSSVTSQVYVGEAAPDFELDGSEGRPVRLAKLKGYWLLLVFADRRAELAPLQQIEPRLRKLGVRPYGVCGDKAYTLGSFARQQKLPFVLLADVTGEVSQLYGLYDSRLSQIRPGFVLVSRQGVVRMALLGQALPYDEMLGLVESAVTGQP